MTKTASSTNYLTVPHLGQRMQNPPHVARVLHLREVVKQRGKTPLANGRGLDL